MAKPPLPGWPRRLDAGLAAAYLGISESWLRENAGTVYPAPQRDGRLVLWDREELDHWVTKQRAGRAVSKPEAGAPKPPANDPVAEAIRVYASTGEAHS